jgi:hypothetical protein
MTEKGHQTHDRRDAKTLSAFNAVHRECAAAYDLILKVYPTLDLQTRAAFQERLFLLEGNEHS